MSGRGFYSVFVNNLHNKTTRNELFEAFRHCGHVQSTYVADYRASETYIFGFVRFTKADAALAAVSEMDQWVLHGHKLRVDLAKETRHKLIKEGHIKSSNASPSRAAISQSQTDEKGLTMENLLNESRIRDCCTEINLEQGATGHQLNADFILADVSKLDCTKSPSLSGDLVGENSRNVTTIKKKIMKREMSRSLPPGSTKEFLQVLKHILSSVISVAQEHAEETNLKKMPVQSAKPSTDQDQVIQERDVNGHDSKMTKNTNTGREKQTTDLSKPIPCQRMSSNNSKDENKSMLNNDRHVVDPFKAPSLDHPRPPLRQSLDKPSSPLRLSLDKTSSPLRPSLDTLNTVPCIQDRPRFSPGKASSVPKLSDSDSQEYESDGLSSDTNESGKSHIATQLQALMTKTGLTEKDEDKLCNAVFSKCNERPEQNSKMADSEKQTDSYHQHLQTMYSGDENERRTLLNQALENALVARSCQGENISDDSSDSESEMERHLRFCAIVASDRSNHDDVDGSLGCASLESEDQHSGESENNETKDQASSHSHLYASSSASTYASNDGIARGRGFAAILKSFQSRKPGLIQTQTSHCEDSDQSQNKPSPQLSQRVRNMRPKIRNFPSPQNSDNISGVHTTSFSDLHHLDTSAFSNTFSDSEIRVQNSQSNVEINSKGQNLSHPTNVGEHQSRSRPFLTEMDVAIDSGVESDSCLSRGSSKMASRQNSILGAVGGQDVDNDDIFKTGLRTAMGRGRGFLRDVLK